MTTHATMAAPVTVRSRRAAGLSATAAAVFLVLLAALHVIEPEFDPSWRVISEYALGTQGGLMVLAFISLALSCVSLSVGLRSHLRTTSGKIGLGFLLISAAGLTIAAIFTADPITASQDQLTAHGNLHGLGAALGTGLPIAAALIGWSLAGNPAWSTVRRSLLWATGVAWTGFLAFSASMAVMLPANGGKLGPDVQIGWPNRFMMVAYGVWLITLAWCAVRLSREGQAR